MDEERGVRDVGGEPARVAKIRAQDVVHRETLCVVDLAEQPVLLGHVVLELLAEEPLVEEVGHADAHPRRLVRVGRAHPLARGADAVLACLGLARAVQRGVIRHDHVRVLGDVEVAVEGDAALDERLHLVNQGGGVHHHSATDDVAAAGMKNARGNRLEDELLASHHHGMTGVVAALIADDHVEVRGDHVDDLPLAFITPLGTHDHDVRHDGYLLLPVSGKYRAGSASTSATLSRRSPVALARSSTRSSLASPPDSPITITRRARRCLA